MTPVDAKYLNELLVDRMKVKRRPVALTYPRRTAVAGCITGWGPPTCSLRFHASISAIWSSSWRTSESTRSRCGR